MMTQFLRLKLISVDKNICKILLLESPENIKNKNSTVWYAN